ncbi:MAG: pyridoxamine 5'-phosphate oxidase [Actinomycetia bacterium]|nr:pyridoxamine 5'-phosphate oxidase [Actinomycetes bacterium]MCP4226645.1 pyridoxamine 5'-phosphate oxidase [Actinomycetes bacterium]MCP5032607.1 pyridoxamine 5'-phosphate oxidase [Actinomycetes bacterium]
MNDEERDQFLAERRIAVLAIERDGKGPLCAPIWYRRTDSGLFEIAMANSSVKAKLLRVSGRATLCVQDESLPYRYVTVEGPVSLRVLSNAERHDVLVGIASRYLGDEGGARYADAFPGHDEALVSLTPERWRTEVLG